LSSFPPRAVAVKGPISNVGVRLVGGLGNQMFGAAAALAVAAREDSFVNFDVSELSGSSKWGRRYELAPFGLNASIRPEPVHRSITTLLNRRRRDVPFDWRGKIWRERHFHYDSSFESACGDVYLIGYFQSPKYFSPIAAQIREAFSRPKLLSEAGKVVVELARGEDSVAVHVRRGDYVQNPKATAHHGILGGDYYQRAIDLISRVVGRPRLFVVSDEPEAARSLLSTYPNAQFVSGTTMIDDMLLISSCRHRIIANSSFGWWGAWLDARLDGITIAPRAWFSREQMTRTYTGDLLPESWLLM
jgi:hypothetical protein